MSTQQQDAAEKLPTIIVKEDQKLTTKFQRMRLVRVKPSAEGSSCVPSRCLFLDDDLAWCDADSAQYHELLVHFPVQYLPRARPQRALLVGDTDGVAARELLKYPSLQELVLLYYDDELFEAVSKALDKDALDSAKKVTKVSGRIDEAIKRVNNEDKLFDLVILDVKNKGVAKKVYDASFADQLMGMLDPVKGILVHDAEYGTLETKKAPKSRVSYGFGSRAMCRRVRFAMYSAKLDLEMADEESWTEQKIETLYYDRKDHHKHVALKDRLAIQVESIKETVKEAVQEINKKESSSSK